MLHLQREDELINFRKAIRPQRAAFSDLERNKQRYIADDLDIYFDDIVDASERIWDMLENFKEVVEALESTNESAIAHRSNEVFRVLTAFSVIFLPLTLIASIWGMNVRVPGDGDATAFYFVLGLPRRRARRPRGAVQAPRLAVAAARDSSARADAARAAEPARAPAPAAAGAACGRGR